MAITKIEGKRRMTELMQRYNLTKQEVLLAHLIASRISLGDAFECVFRSTAHDKDSACKRYISGKPAIEMLANALSNGDADRIASPANQLANVDLRTKEGVLTALEEELKNASETKQRTEIISKIADLQRMKNEEDRNSQDLIFYYLPLRCEECPYKARIDEIKNQADL